MTLRHLSTAVIGLALALGATLAQPSAQRDVFVITGVTIIDLAASRADGALKKNQTVIVTGHRIVSVGATDRIPVPSGARRIDGRGKFLMPGIRGGSLPNDGNARRRDVRRSEGRGSVRRFVRNNTWHVPTLVVDGPVVVDQAAPTSSPRLKYMRASTREQWQRDQRQRIEATGAVAAWKPRVERRLRPIRDMDWAGVALLPGTDADNPYLVPGFSLHDELALLVRAGVSPFDPLRSATENPVRFLNATDRFGSIEPERTADLVLLDANPLQDIEPPTRRTN